MKKQKNRKVLAYLDIYKNTKILFKDADCIVATLEIEGLDNDETCLNSAKIDILKERDNGKPDKVIASFRTSSPNLSIMPEDVLRSFDYVFVIDTGTRIVDDQKFCAAAVGRLINHNGKIALIRALHICFTTTVEDKSFEKISWKYFIEELLLNNDHQHLQKENIAIVVDAYLGDLDDFNKWKEILEGFSLPSNIKLIYASADKKNDSVLNWAIAECDKGATNLLKSVI